MKYRKRPVIIEAIQNIPENFNLIRLLVGDSRPLHQLGGGRLQISTLEGEMIANVGDWIIKGFRGECYPCKPDIFIATYEKVEL